MWDIIGFIYWAYFLTVLLLALDWKLGHASAVDYSRLEWRDIWVGIYWDIDRFEGEYTLKQDLLIYCCPVPCWVTLIRIQIRPNLYDFFFSKFFHTQDK